MTEKNEELKTTLVKKWKVEGYKVELRMTDGVPVFYYVLEIDGMRVMAIESFMLNVEPKISLRKGVFHFRGHCEGFMFKMFQRENKYNG